MSFRIAIDTGGTFTDAISVDEKGNVVTAKVPTTPQDLSRGTINAIDALASLNNLGLREFLSQTTCIVHGTTMGTNTLIERSGPKMGIISTEGHPDVIQLRRVPKEDMWNWRMPFPEPLVPRYLRVEVKERVGSRGEVLKPLDEESVRKAVLYLKNQKVESIVVGLLFSFLYPDHERKVGEIIKEEYPEAHVTLSSTILPALGEYERTSTAVISAYIAPAITSYIKTLTGILDEEGFDGQFLFMQNNGGVQTAEIAMEKPATLAMSGPSAGPSSAIVAGSFHGKENLLSLDMGGTSLDCAIIHKGSFWTKTESLIANQRFSLPVIDVNAIGAGGGSIAWLDRAGTLNVGPRSAGAVPGPACYDLGGEEPTVTDADVVLGYISPDFFLGGEMKLRKDLSEKAIKEKVADPLGLSTLDAAAAIYKIINSAMADAVSYSFTKHGYDPRDFIFCAGGAASPIHIIRIAQDLGVLGVLVPKFSPIYCAFGMLNVDLKHDFSTYYHTAGDDLDLEQVKKLYDNMEAEALGILEKEKVPKEKQVFIRTMQIRYYGQFREVEVEWPYGSIDEDAINSGIAAFHRKHKALYGYSDENYPVEFMSFGLTVIGKIDRAGYKKIESGSTDPSQALKGERGAYFEESGGLVNTPVYDGDKLLSGNILEGPCIVEERMTNIVIPPAFKAKVDEYGNYITVE